jgi:hypothetical protein
MTLPRFDFAVVGDTPLARLLAGLLASAHGKSVAFQGESQSAYRLPRGLDLSAAPITRPETWEMLRLLVPETSKLLSKVGGRQAVGRIDPWLFAEDRAAKEMLSHVRHMAEAFDWAVEPVAARDLGAGREGIVLRDVLTLHRAALEARLDTWLDGLGVRRLPAGAPLKLVADGGSWTKDADEEVAATQTVLVGDWAIETCLPIAQWPKLLAGSVYTTVVTEPTPPMAAPLMLQLDSGLTMTQPAKRGISAMGPGELDLLTARLRELMGPERQLRLAGQVSYRRVVTKDGAPAVGRVGGRGPDVVAGFGATGAFFAPALARWLAGVARAPEEAWLGARLVDRDPERSIVTEAGGPA